MIYLETRKIKQDGNFVRKTSESHGGRRVMTEDGNDPCNACMAPIGDGFGMYIGTKLTKILKLITETRMISHQ